MAYRALLPIVVLVFAGAAMAGGGNNYARGVQAFDRGDFRVALEYLAPLAENGHAPAQKMLGTMYALGLGVRPDRAVGVEWLRAAAESGESEAAQLLAWHRERLELSDQAQGLPLPRLVPVPVEAEPAPAPPQPPEPPSPVLEEAAAEPSGPGVVVPEAAPADDGRVEVVPVAPPQASAGQALAMASLPRRATAPPVATDIAVGPACTGNERAVSLVDRAAIPLNFEALRWLRTQPEVYARYEALVQATRDNDLAVAKQRLAELVTDVEARAADSATLPWLRAMLHDVRSRLELLDGDRGAALREAELSLANYDGQIREWDPRRLRLLAGVAEIAADACERLDGPTRERLRAFRRGSTGGGNLTLSADAQACQSLNGVLSRMSREMARAGACAAGPEDWGYLSDLLIDPHARLLRDGVVEGGLSLEYPLQRLDLVRAFSARYLQAWQRLLTKGGSNAREYLGEFEPGSRAEELALELVRARLARWPEAEIKAQSPAALSSAISQYARGAGTPQELAAAAALRALRERLGQL